jgi:hypothetical protein
MEKIVAVLNGLVVLTLFLAPARFAQKPVCPISQNRDAQSSTPWEKSNAANCDDNLFSYRFSYSNADLGDPVFGVVKSYYLKPILGDKASCNGSPQEFPPAAQSNRGVQGTPLKRPFYENNGVRKSVTMSLARNKVR